MTTLTAGGPRVVRASILAVTACSLALLGHLVAGGSSPAPAVVLLAFVGALVPALLVTSRRVSTAGALGLLGLSQLVLHRLFELPAAGSVHACVSAGTHSLHQLTPCAPVVGGATHVVHEGHAGTTMVAGHALAVVLTAVLVARGERCAWVVLSWIVRRALLAVPHLPPTASPLRAGPPCPQPRLPALVLGAAPRRGPPALTC